MLQRTTDSVSAGCGNDQICAGEPGGPTGGSAGGGGISGSRAGRRGQGIGSGQTRPVRPGCGAVVAGRCWRHGAFRGGSCRGGAPRLLPVRSRPDSGVRSREVQRGADDLDAGCGRGFLQRSQAILGGVAVCRDVRFRGGYRVLGQHDRGRLVNERRIRNRRFGRWNRVRKRGSCRRRVRRHRVGWCRCGGRGRGCRCGRRIRGRRRWGGGRVSDGRCRLGTDGGRGWVRRGRRIRHCRVRGRRGRRAGTSRGGVGDRLGRRFGCRRGRRQGGCRSGNSGLGGEERRRRVGGVRRRLPGDCRGRNCCPRRSPGREAGRYGGFDDRRRRLHAKFRRGDGGREGDGSGDGDVGRGRGGGGFVCASGRRREGQPGESGGAAKDYPPERTARARRH